MEFSETLPCASDSVKSDILFVKEELEDDNIADAHDNHDESANEECMELMEVTEEKPVIAEIFHNSATTDIKQENAEDVSSAGTQDFVFVACADHVASNQIKLENQNTSVREQENTNQPCPYCGKTFTVLHEHKAICEMKYVYPCPLCPSIFYRSYFVKRHLQMIHHRELNGFSLNEIYEEIVAKRVELNVETAAEKIKVVSELMTNASLRPQMTFHLAEKVAETPVPIFVSVAEKDVPQNNNVSNVIGSSSTSEKSDVVGSEVIVECVRCNECDYEARNKADLDSHMSTKHSAQLDLISFECSKCKKNFKSYDQLNTHKTKCSIKTFYRCLFCPKLLLIKANIVSHIQDQHVEEVANRNPIEIAALVEANKRVVDLSNISREEFLARNFNDSPDNDVVFVDSDAHEKSNVSSVMIVASEEMIIDEPSVPTVPKKAVHRKPKYMFCSECPYKTTNQELLQRHITNYHNRVNLQVRQCRNCEKNFTCRDDLKTHEAACSIRIYFSCLFCDKIFLRKLNVTKHLSQKHFKEVENQDNEGIERLVESGKRLVDTSIIEVEKESTMIIDSEKKSSKIKDTERKSRKIIDSEKESSIIANNENDGIERLVEAEKGIVDTSIIETEKESEMIIDNEKKSSNIKETEKKSRKIIGREKKSSKIVDTEKKSTKIINTKNKITKPKIQYFQCDHCRFKTHRKSILVGHIKKKHPVDLNERNSKGRFNYKCAFCPNVYVRMDMVKMHVSQKHPLELLNRTLDEVAEEIFSQRFKVVGPSMGGNGTFVDPDEIDASTLDYVLVYCGQCKTLKTTCGTLRTRKNNCRDCDGQIIYLCSKCKNSHSLFYAEFQKHWKQCTEMNNISQDYLDKLMVYKCAQCNFSSTHKSRFNMHVVRSKHKQVKGADGKSVEEEKKDQNAEDLELYDEAKFAIRPCVVDYATMTLRYCPKCDKVVTEEMQPRTPNSGGLNCKTCKARFHAQCVKCNIRWSSWPSMRYHLNTKCYSGEYLCTKCPERKTNWQAMQKHYLFRHTNRREWFLCEFCSFRSLHGMNLKVHMKKMHADKAKHVFINPQRDVDYACDLCSFTSKRKGCLKMHLHTVHGPKKHKCKLCKFATKYEASFKRHVATRHQNFY